ncbi:MAG: ABC transporter ATP-binding protein [Brevundimonas sp.]|uniref:ABC transporter ATP-binding protein n=1 Tax=Brevundimonas sp. TaxID=1871086 RepID=UPI00391D7403
MSVLSRLPPPARRQLRLLPAVIGLGLIAAALEGFGIGLVIPMLSIIMGADAAGAAGGLPARLQAIGAGLDDGARLAVIAGAVFILIGLKNAVSFLNSVLTAYIYGHAGHAVRRSLSDQLLQVGFPFLRQEDPGRLLNIISNESWSVSDAVNAMLSMVVSACAAVVLAALLLALSWQMTLLVGLGVAVISLLHAAVSSALRRKGRHVAERNSWLAARMLHLVHAGQLIRVFNMQDRERSAFNTASDQVRRAAFSVQQRLALLGPLTEVLYAGLFLAIVVGAWAAGVSFPLVVAFVVLLYRLQPYIRGVQSSWSQLQSQLGSIEEVSWLLDPHGRPVAPQGAAPAFPPKEQIRFQAVEYDYASPSDGGRALVLRGADFHIRPNRSTALIGRSGAGKTTVVNLLCRLVDPTSGRIWVDDVPLDTMNPKDWRRLVAIASQDLELVDASILDNILYGAESATREDAIAAAQLAEAHEFVMALPEGYSTVVGFRGLSLSAGQRQRIALARALVRQPDILILDEATNAVDGLSEAAILSTLAKRSGHGTTILISHHRTTLAGCDDVVVLQDGLATGPFEIGNSQWLDMDDLYALRASSGGA